MCGIFGAVLDKNQASQIVYSGLQRLEYRGYDSWGLAIAKKGEIQQEKRVGAISQSLALNLPQAKVALGHTRWATHGKISRKNTHPHLARDKKFTLVHNGVVQNAQELKEKLLTSHYLFKSETDTEVILGLIEKELEKKQQVYPTSETTLSVAKQLEGRNSFAVLTEQGQILALRSGSPLLIGKNEQGFYLSSDLVSLSKVVESYFSLESGQVASLHNPQSLSITRSSGEKVKIPWQQSQFVQNNEELRVDHYMLKEIREQPVSLVKVIDQSRDKLATLCLNLSQASCIYLVGAGSASYAAEQISFWLRQQGLNARAVPAYGLKEEQNNFSSKDVVIALSQSGETADTIQAVETMKKQGSVVISLINMPGSSLARLSDLTFPLQVGPELAVASTKALTGQLLWGKLVCQLLAGQKLEQFQKELKKYCSQLERWLSGDLDRKLDKLVLQLKNQQHLFVLGFDQLIYPAKEIALKIKEVSYLHAEAFRAGELKHGVIALIEEDSPVIYLATLGKKNGQRLNAAIEAKSRGARLIGLTDFSNPIFNDWLNIGFSPCFKAISMIIVGQVLAYKLALAKGINPDRPRNLAKSVTVN